MLLSVSRQGHLGSMELQVCDQYFHGCTPILNVRGSLVHLVLRVEGSGVLGFFYFHF